MDAMIVLIVAAYPAFLWACVWLRPKKEKIQFRITDFYGFVIGFTPTMLLLSLAVNRNIELLPLVYFVALGQVCGAVFGCAYSGAYQYGGWESALEVAAWTFMGGVLLPIVFGIIFLGTVYSGGTCLLAAIWAIGKFRRDWT